MADFESQYEQFISNLIGRDEFEEDGKIFRREKDISTMIRYVWSLKEFQNGIRFPYMLTKKDEELSVRLRFAGNQYYTKNKLEDALRCYNESILDAYYPMDDCPSSASTNLACVFNNRSAVFYEMKRYDLCLTDIRRSLNLNYPIHMHDKLLKREIKCHIAKNEFGIAKERYNVYVADVKYMNNKRLLRSLKDIMSKIKEEVTTDTEEYSALKPAISYREVPPIKNPNKYIPAVSDALEMNISPLKDRGFIATRDILPGEAIMQEKPICSFLLLNCLRTRCSNCLKSIEYAPLPCKGCSNVIFCDETCRDEAYEMFHRVECPMISALKVMGIEYCCCLTLRLLCQLGAEEILKKFHLYETQCLAGASGGVGPDEECVYQSDDIINAFHLTSHKDLIQSGDLIAKCTMTLLVIKLYARYSSELPSTMSDFCDSTLSDDQITLASCMFLLMLNISSNGHSITEIQGHKEHYREDVIGHGIYLTLSMLNHSCDPNTETNFIGLGMVTRASQFIKANSEVLSCYVNDFGASPEETRVQILKDNYYFNCTCTACREHWPVYDLVSKEVTLKCPCCLATFYGGACKNCNAAVHELYIADGDKSIPFAEIIQRRSQLQVELSTKNRLDVKQHTKAEIQAAKSAIIFFNKYCIMPSQPMLKAQIILRRAMVSSGYSSSM